MRSSLWMIVRPLNFRARSFFRAINLNRLLVLKRRFPAASSSLRYSSITLTTSLSCLSFFCRTPTFNLAFRRSCWKARMEHNFEQNRWLEARGLSIVFSHNAQTILRGIAMPPLCTRLYRSRHFLEHHFTLFPIFCTRSPQLMQCAFDGFAIHIFSAF